MQNFNSHVAENNITYLFYNILNMKFINVTVMVRNVQLNYLIVLILFYCKFNYGRIRICGLFMVFTVKVEGELEARSSKEKRSEERHRTRTTRSRIDQEYYTNITVFILFVVARCISQV